MNQGSIFRHIANGFAAVEHAPQASQVRNAQFSVLASIRFIVGERLQQGYG